MEVMKRKATARYRSYNTLNSVGEVIGRSAQIGNRFSALQIALMSRQQHEQVITIIFIYQVNSHSFTIRPQGNIYRRIKCWRFCNEIIVPFI
jgi:hypothetical protein